MELINRSIETSFIGSLYKDPDLYINFGKSIKSHYDFADQSCKWLYDKFELFYLQFCDKRTKSEINENPFNVFMSQNQDDLKAYKEIGGWKTIEKLKGITETENIDGYYDILKKYSLLRELKHKGFPVDKITSRKDFDKLTGENILQIMQYNMNHIITNVYNKRGVDLLTANTVEHIEQYCLNPHVGTPFRWRAYTDVFLGRNKGDFLLNFGLCNSGKGRKDVSSMAYTAFIENKKVVALDNEMSYIKIKNAMITTILNDTVYGYCLNKPEREIKLGIYKDETEKKKVLDVARFIESNKNWYFVEMYKFDDTDLERESKKYAIGLGCEFLYYGTLKGYKNSDWGALKQTATHLKNLAGELGIFVSATAQLTMDSVNINIMDLNEQNIGESKGIIHVADLAIIDKEISPHELNKFALKDNAWGIVPLDANKRWYGSKIIKNRDGSKPVLCNEVNLDLNTWSEYSQLIKP